MNRLLEDRRLLIPTILTALVIAIGSTLIIVLAGEDSGGGSASSSSGGAAPAASSGPAEGGPGETVAVNIADFKFEPAQLTVESGTSVEWTNEDDAPHNARGDGGVDTENLDKGESDAVELTEPGTFEYICSLHAFMKATVTVR